jgi:hypothetical protein
MVAGHLAINTARTAAALLSATARRWRWRRRRGTGRSPRTPSPSSAPRT